MGFFGGLEPASERHFLACIEHNALLALNVQISEERAIPTGERKPGHGGGHANVDPDHPGVEVLFEFTSCIAAACENRCSVPKFALATDLQSRWEIGDAYHR